MLFTAKKTGREANTIMYIVCVRASAFVCVMCNAMHLYSSFIFGYSISGLS